MSGKSWKGKYETKHGYPCELSNDSQNAVVDDTGRCFSINADENLDFESDPDMKRVLGLDVEYPEGIKSVRFSHKCTLLGKVLDGEFILKDNESEDLMVLWQNGLLFLTTRRVINVNGKAKFYELGEHTKFSDDLVGRIQLLKDDTQNIEERLKSVGISFLLRADTIGFPDYNTIMLESRKMLVR